METMKYAFFSNQLSMSLVRTSCYMSPSLFPILVSEKTFFFSVLANPNCLRNNMLILHGKYIEFNSPIKWEQGNRQYFLSNSGNVDAHKHANFIMH